MRITKEAKLDVLTLAALQGILTPLPDDRECQEQILSLMDDLGGIKLAHSAKEVIDKALRFYDEGAKLTHVVVNKLYGTDVVITLLVSDEECPITSDADILSRNGVLGYCYNATYPDCSELGYSFYAKHRDGTIHRIG